MAALGHMAPEARETLPGITQALRDTEAHVRQAAGYALARFGTEAIAAVPALIEALLDDSQYVREGALGALQDITAQDLGDDAAAWQAWWDAQP